MTSSNDSFKVKNRITKIIAPKLPDVDLSMLRGRSSERLDDGSFSLMKQK